MGAKKATAAAEKKARFTVVLNDAAGNRLTVVAAETVVKGGPAFRSAVVHNVDGKGKRGMVAWHESFASARERAESLAAEAVNLGWAKVERAVRKPAFDAIPAPDKTPKPKAEKPKAKGKKAA